MSEASTEHYMVVPGQLPDGMPILSVILKRSYKIWHGTRAVRIPKTKPLVRADTPYGEPMRSPIAFESDLVPFKPATDVVINATAHAPNGEAVQELAVSVLVGNRRKDLQIIGDRSALFRRGQDPLFTEPRPFARMPVRYDLAYGGIDVRSDPNMPATYLRNHLGRGFVVRNAEESVHGVALPNIEAPGDRLTPERLCCGHFMHWERQPMPDGLGWVMKAWHPRARLAGVMPGDRALERGMRRHFLGVVPPEQRDEYAKTALPEMDFRFFNGASSGLALPLLAGNERLGFRNLHAEHDIVTFLPAERPRVALDLGPGEQEAAEIQLATVMVRLHDFEIDLVWTAPFRYPGMDWLPKMRRLQVSVA